MIPNFWYIKPTPQAVRPSAANHCDVGVDHVVRLVYITRDWLGFVGRWTGGKARSDNNSDIQDETIAIRTSRPRQRARCSSSHLRVEYTLVTLPRIVTPYRDSGRDSWPRNVSNVGYTVTLRACSVCCRYLAVASKGMIRSRPQQVWACNVTLHAHTVTIRCYDTR